MPDSCRILIGVLSAEICSKRRHACRDTWAGVAQSHPEIELVFALGASATAGSYRDRDIVYLRCPDDYPSLPQKTRAFCQWAIKAWHFDYLMKCDDDTYVHSGRLLAAHFSGEYIGHDMGGYASGGAGYLLSPRAAQIIANNVTALTGFEDIEVGQALKARGITLTSDDRFQPWPKRGRAPSPRNELITGHGWKPDQLRAIHAQFATP